MQDSTDGRLQDAEKFISEELEKAGSAILKNAHNIASERLGSFLLSISISILAEHASL